MPRDQLSLFDRDEFKNSGDEFKDPRFYEHINPEKRYRVAEAAEKLDCDKSYIYKLIKLGRLQYVQVGLIRVPGWALIDFIKERSSEY